MQIANILLAIAILLSTSHAVLAEPAKELTACAAITAADAEKFVGAPLEVSKIDKKIMLNAPWTHDSLCTYTPQGENSDDPTTIARFLDVSLRFFPTAAAAQAIHQATLEQFRKSAGSDSYIAPVSSRPSDFWCARSYCRRSSITEFHVSIKGSN